MPWFPGAIRRPVTRHRTPMSRHRGLCLHVAVSEGASLFGYFNQPGNPTSHFYVRRDGTVEQYVDTQFRAPAQLEGNPTMISAETQGGVHNVDTEQWTPQQVTSLARIAAWCNDVHGIRLGLMPDSRPQSTGVGPHRLGIDPWRVSGGEHWSESYGKVCPGAGKIAQIPRIIALARGEDEVTEAQANRIIQLLEELTAQGRLMAVRMDSITNQQLPGLRADADRAADVIAGPDDSVP